MWFCDWLTARLPYKTVQPICGGFVQSVNEHGEREWEVVKRKQVSGSYEDTISVRTRGDDIEVSGNPTKWTQGHNLYGAPLTSYHGALLGLLLMEALGVDPQPEDVRKWFANAATITRIDLTRMYRPDWAQPGWVAKWLAIAGTYTHGGQRKVTPASAYDGGTMYVGKGSTRKQLKIYDKAKELRKHPPHWETMPPSGEGMSAKSFLEGYVADTLRVEVQLRSQALKRMKVGGTWMALDRLDKWTVAIGDQVLDDEIANLQISEDIRMIEYEVADLPRRLREVYECWRGGADLRTLYSRPTFYRHRKALLAHGIDIVHTQPHLLRTEREYEMGRPLKDYLAGGGLEPPPEFYGGDAA